MGVQSALLLPPLCPVVETRCSSNGPLLLNVTRRSSSLVPVEPFRSIYHAAYCIYCPQWERPPLQRLSKSPWRPPNLQLPAPPTCRSFSNISPSSKTTTPFGWRSAASRNTPTAKKRCTCRRSVTTARENSRMRATACKRTAKRCPARPPCSF